jgi:hypothetical protein
MIQPGFNQGWNLILRMSARNGVDNENNALLVHIFNAKVLK